MSNISMANALPYVYAPSLSINSDNPTSEAVRSAQSHSIPTASNTLPSTIVSITDSFKVDADGHEQTVKYWNVPIHDSVTSLLSLKGELTKLNQKIQNERPSLIGKQWDFVLSGGRIVIQTGRDVSAGDAEWLSEQLNDNPAAVAAIKDYYAAVTTYFEHSKDVTGVPVDPATRQYKYAVSYKDVSAQIDGKIAIRSVLDALYKKGSSPPEPDYAPAAAKAALAYANSKALEQGAYAFGMDLIKKQLVSCQIPYHTYSQPLSGFGSASEFDPEATTYVTM